MANYRKPAKVWTIIMVMLIGLFGAGCFLGEKKTAAVDVSSYYNLREHILQGDFDIERNYDTKDISLNVDGKYDFNKDGKMDSIEIRLVGRKDSYIRVNESEISIDCETPMDFYLVDLMKDDKLVEFAIYDDGASGDPETAFYRYDGKEVCKLGSVNTDINTDSSIYPYYGDVLTDGRGNFITPTSIAKFVSPNIIKSYHSLEKDKFVYKPLDYSKHRADEYTLTADFQGFLVEQNFDKDLKEEDIEFTWDEEQIVQFKKGEKVQIVLVGEYWYAIERQDGTRGILYFWVGD